MDKEKKDLIAKYCSLSSRKIRALSKSGGTCLIYPTPLMGKKVPNEGSGGHGIFRWEPLDYTLTLHFSSASIFISAFKQYLKVQMKIEAK